MAQEAVTDLDASRTAGLSALRSEQEPKDESGHGQDQDDDDPQHFDARRRVALDGFDNRPNIQYQDDESKKAANFHTHSAPPRLPAARGRSGIERFRAGSH